MWSLAIDESVVDEPSAGVVGQSLKHHWRRVHTTWPCVAAILPALHWRPSHASSSTRRAQYYSLMFLSPQAWMDASTDVTMSYICVWQSQKNVCVCEEHMCVCILCLLWVFVCQCKQHTNRATVVFSILKLADFSAWFTAAVLALNQTSTQTLTLLVTSLWVPIIPFLRNTHTYKECNRNLTLNISRIIHVYGFLHMKPHFKVIAIKLIPDKHNLFFRLDDWYLKEALTYINTRH